MKNVGDLYIERTDGGGFLIGPRLYRLYENPCILVAPDDPSIDQWRMFFASLVELEESKALTPSGPNPPVSTSG